MPYPPPGVLPDPRVQPASLISPALAGRFFTTSSTWQALGIVHVGGKGKLVQNRRPFHLQVSSLLKITSRFEILLLEGFLVLWMSCFVPPPPTFHICGIRLILLLYISFEVSKCPPFFHHCIPFYTWGPGLFPSLSLCTRCYQHLEYSSQYWPGWYLLTLEGSGKCLYL